MLSKKFKIILLFSIFLFLSINVCFAGNNNESNIHINDENTNLNSNESSYKVKTISDSSKNSKNQKLAAGDSPPSSILQSKILASAYSVKNQVIKNKKLPDYVTIDDYKFSMPEYLYLLSKTLKNRYLGSSAKVTIKYNVKNPKNPAGNSLNIKIYKKPYTVLANNVLKYMDKYNYAPNYAIYSSSKIQYQTLIYGFSNVLSYHYTNRKLPNYLSLNIKNSHSLNKNIPSYNRPSIDDGNNESNNSNSNSSNNNSSENNGVYPVNISQSNILSVSSSLKNYIEEYGKLPAFVSISGKRYSINEYTYLLSKTIVYKYTNSNLNVTVKYNIKNPTKPSGNSINATIPKVDYYDIYNRLANYLYKYGKAPNLVISKYGNIQYQTAIYGLSKIGDFYLKNKVLPTYLSLVIKNTHSLNSYFPDGIDIN